MIEKKEFDKSTCVWVIKNTSHNLIKDVLLMQSIDVINKSSLQCFMTDAFPYVNILDATKLNFEDNLYKNLPLDVVLNNCVEICEEIYNTPFESLSVETWINRVQSQNPVQSNYKYKEKNDIDKYHNHVKISQNNGMFRPYLTFVYYIQMPENMADDDGVLYFKSKDNGTEYSILPNEGDIIVMEGDVDHAPNFSPNSKLDRIVFAGNIGFK